MRHLLWSEENSPPHRGAADCLILSLPRVINFKFHLQPHQKYASHSMKNLPFHSLLRLKMIVLPNYQSITHALPYKSLGERSYLNLRVKGSSGTDGRVVLGSGIMVTVRAGPGAGSGWRFPGLLRRYSVSEE